VRSLSLSARGDIENLGSESGGAGEGLFVVVLDLRPLCLKSMQGLLAIDSRVAFWTADSLLMPEASAEQELGVGIQPDHLTSAGEMRLNGVCDGEMDCYSRVG
jgi:hypothetical protein